MLVKNKTVGTDEHLMTCSHPASSNYPSKAGSEIRTFMQSALAVFVLTRPWHVRLQVLLCLETGEILIEQIT